ncbi:MAG: toxin-antitoxin system HicB family antitoxin, partial [Acidimicrobiales bacterium]
VDGLRTDLAGLGGLGDQATAEAAGRLAGALEGAVTMRLLQFLGQVAVELSAQMPAGRVEVRLAGQDPELVYVEDDAGPGPTEGDAELSARITLRLSEGLKAHVEAAAGAERVSANTWILRALGRAVRQPGGWSIRVQRGLSGYGRS